MKYRKLLTVENAKTTKGESLGYLTGILYLAPASSSGLGNICPKASSGCISLCLFGAGRGRFAEIANARKAKTELFFTERAFFMDSLQENIRALVRKAEREGLKPAVRLNGTSDLPILSLTLCKDFPDVQFYDYTKIPIAKNDVRLRAKNYHLTFSRSENNWIDCEKALALGVNVAVPFLGEVPKTYNSCEVIDGDEHDLRFLDKKGVIVGLTYKKIVGQKNPAHGFIVHAGKGE